MSSAPDSPRRPKVLVVDDEESVVRTTAAVLAEDYEVETARGAEEALHSLKAKPADVLCTDLNMPGINGIELIRRVREAYPGIATVLVTGFTDFLKGERRETDVFLLLVKPYRPPQLIETVRKAANLSSVSRAMNSIRPQ